MKIFEVEEDVYWVDNSLKEARENYKSFCLDEMDYYEDPGSDYPVEINEQEARAILIEDCSDSKTLYDIFKSVKKAPALIYCDIF